MNKIYAFITILLLFTLSSCDMNGYTTVVKSVNKNQVAAPVFSPSSTTAYADLEVAISCATSKAAIYYTTDGSEPTIYSNIYNEPILIQGHGTQMTIIAIAVKEGMIDSNTTSAEYIIDYSGDTTADEQAIAVDKATLEIGYASGDSASFVTQNITLLSSGSNGTTITWASSNTSIIQTDGTVIRPTAGDSIIVLTATIAKGRVSDTKTFTLTVRASSFITKWKTDNTGYTVSNNNEIKLPLDSNGTYNFVVEWGDGTRNTITSYNQPEITHGYVTPGTYTITITGQIEGFGFKSSGEDSSKFIDVIQWGGVKLHNEGGQFINCNNLTDFSATGSPHLSNITNMSSMFYNAGKFNDDISTWNVSSVTDMSYMFYYAGDFNGNISTWNVGNVTNMSYMFQNAVSFNQDLSLWDVSNVTDMSYMFSAATSFNGNISTWNVGKVKKMERMFNAAYAFNQNLSLWNVSAVENMNFMFSSANVFNGNISTWNVGNVTNMRYMFNSADAFNQNLNSWNVSKVTDMSNMFGYASAFNGNISGWNVSNVQDMNAMFTHATSFNQNLNSWVVSNVTDMSNMFSFASAFNGDISSWNVSKVEDMLAMFFFATSFNGNISSWNVSSVKKMRSMFANASSFNQDLPLWNVSSVTSMESMFSEATSFNGNITTWQVESVTNMRYMFYNAANFDQNLSGWCVETISPAPENFSAGSGLDSGDMPQWGVSVPSCP